MHNINISIGLHLLNGLKKLGFSKTSYCRIQWFFQLSLN